ncbi:hypothetical protein LSUB1_G001475 [Lachnellula subtilissima]|uniref:DUF7907 domain-containing protein n=1 Tax=Lachnellula subtilissima TaxID=602034 RepID=A0A8H8S1D6_9HELO|nr:hypothetical protein LSUB1_G001475 [Lachnellula subtilissima]
MRILTTTGFLALAVVQVIVVAQFNVAQSAPFYLVLKSRNSSLNGAYLSPCHEGAAENALCPTKEPLTDLTYNQFYYNSSVPDAQYPYGTLGWNLQIGEGSNAIHVPQPMIFQYNDASNVAVPLIFFGNPTSVEFGPDNRMTIFSFRDDTKPLSLGNTNYSAHLSRWYVCDTIPSWYLYQTLAGAMGNAKPQNPSCQKVEVYRKWA